MKKRWMKTAFVGAAALTLAACGGGGNGTGDTAGQTGGEQAVEQTSMPDRPFVYVAQQVVGSIDPAKVVDETERIAAVNLYDTLYFPERTDGSMAPAPHLATDYEVSEDGMVYTVNLRDDVTFHSGNQMTAEDVVYSMERQLAIGEGNAWLWEGLFTDEGVVAQDDHTVVFNLNEPYAPFVSSLTQLYVVDSQLLQENEENGDYGQAYLESNDAGSGPYTLNQWDRETEISFSSFEDYFLGWEGEGRLEEVQMKFVPEEATVKTLLASGQADMVHQFLNPTAYDEFEGMDGVVMQEDPSAALQEITINTQKAPTDDLNVRKAIATAFDYATAADQIMNGATQAEGPVPVTVDGHSEDVTVFQQNLEEAQQLIEASDYAGEELTVTFMYLGDVAQQRQFSQLVTANLAEIGINVELEQATWPQVTEAAANPETTANLTVITDSLKYPHVDSHTFGKYHPSTHGSFRSMSWLDDEEVTQTLEEARTAVSVEEQTELYKEAQNLIADQAPAIYVANTTHRIAYRDYVEGYEYVPLAGYDITFYYFQTN